jgi:hypothetical protein
MLSGHNEALTIHRDAMIQPGGVRVRANEQKEMMQGTGMGGARLAVTEDRCGETRALVSLQHVSVRRSGCISQSSLV